MRSKHNRALEFTLSPEYLLCSHTKKVRESMSKNYFKILLVSKPQYLSKPSFFSVVSGEIGITGTKCDISFD